MFTWAPSETEPTASLLVLGPERAVSETPLVLTVPVTPPPVPQLLLLV